MVGQKEAMRPLFIKHTGPSLCQALFLAIAILLLGGAAHAQEKKGVSDGNLLENTLTYPIRFYKIHASGADGARCPMTPSCSTYALNAFHKHGAVMGWIMTCDRLMRCGRDEVKQAEKVNVGQRWLNADPVENNDFWWE